MSEIDALLEDAVCRRILGNMGKTPWHELDRRGALPKAIKIGRKCHRLASEMAAYDERLAAARDDRTDPGKGA